MEKIELSINQIDQLQDELVKAYKFVVKYLKEVSLSEMEKQILREFEYIMDSISDLHKNDFRTFILPYLETMKYFYEKHPKFCDSLFILRKYKKFFYLEFYLDLFKDIEIEIKKSKLNPFFVRFDLI